MSTILIYSSMLCALLLAPAPERSAVEQDPPLLVEAEDYHRQSKDDIRKWEKYTDSNGVTYLKLLPDTRKNHDEKLIVGENFTNEPGVMAILDYQVDFPAAGKYYVWVRARSHNSEDNGIHVGLNGDWPESGQRMQWCEGKQEWYWDSKQRTKEVHCGVPELIYLDIPSPGVHTVSFSMREDGFEFDAFQLTREYRSPGAK